VGIVKINPMSFQEKNIQSLLLAEVLVEALVGGVLAVDSAEAAPLEVVQEESFK
jgi:hypothetical protein